ncbi:MAG: hypothetical protein GY762_22850 [Proteobacteria bacterium]|nr:hypothetical protein [Pseudomonadota bacterium]
MPRRKSKKKRSTTPAVSKADTAETRRGTPAIPQWTGHATWVILVLAVVGFFLILKMFSMNAYAGDEHIYLYQAKLVAQGTIPYADFAMAHPPFQTLFTALLFKLFGYSFLFGRMLPVLWCLLGGLALAIMVRREYGIVASIASISLFLLAYEPLRASSHYTGVNMTVALLLFAVLAYRVGAIRTAALISVLAVFTRLYAAPGVLVLAVYAILVRPREGLRLVVWGAGLGVIAVVAVGLWTGFYDLFHNLVLYHAQKTPMSEAALKGMQDRILFHNALEGTLFALAQCAILGTVFRALTKQKAKSHPHFFAKLKDTLETSHTGLVILSSCIALSFLAVLTNMDRVWMYYFIPSFPFAAVASGWLISRWVHTLRLLILARGNIRQTEVSIPGLVGGSLLFAVFVVCTILGPRLEENLTYYQKAMNNPVSERTRTYTWRSGLLPTSVNAAVEKYLWQEKRTIGTAYNRFNYLLWHESRILDIVDEVVRTIDEEVSKDGEIFGDSGTVPLFALLSDRCIAADEVDTNIQRYRSGNADPKKLIEKIDHPKTEMIILRNRFGVAGVLEVKQLIHKKYKPVKRLRTFTGRTFFLYQRQG